MADDNVTSSQNYAILRQSAATKDEKTAALRGLLGEVENKMGAITEDKNNLSVVYIPNSAAVQTMNDPGKPGARITYIGEKAIELMTPQVLDAVLAHEVAHVMAKDPASSQQAEYSADLKVANKFGPQVVIDSLEVLKTLYPESVVPNPQSQWPTPLQRQIALVKVSDQPLEIVHTVPSVLPDKLSLSDSSLPSPGDKTSQLASSGNSAAIANIGTTLFSYIGGNVANKGSFELQLPKPGSRVLPQHADSYVIKA